MGKIIVRKFEEFSAKELYEVLKARAEVFIVEQNCIYQDLDGIDYESYHVIGYENGKIVAYLRIFVKDSDKNMVQMGRVLTTERGKGYGAEIVKEGIRVAWEILCADRIYIEAQCYAIGFYEKFGFKAISEEFLEDGIPHIQMELKII